MASIFKHSDGKVSSYIRLGSEEATPIVFFHGFPGSHEQALIFRDVLKPLNIQVLCVDRPGYGLSESAANMKSYLQRVCEITDSLGYKKFSAVGVSGGGPYATALAHKEPQRVHSLGLICALSPFKGNRQHFGSFQKVGLTLSSLLPAVHLRKILNVFEKNVSPEAKIEILGKNLSVEDLQLLRDLQFRPLLLSSMELARKQGALGMAFDLKNYSRDWEIRFEQIKQPCFVWHGENDKVLSPTMATYFKEQIPHASLKLIPNEGHYSLPVLRIKEMMEELIKSPGEPKTH